MKVRKNTQMFTNNFLVLILLWLINSYIMNNERHKGNISFYCRYFFKVFYTSLIVN